MYPLSVTGQITVIHGLTLSWQCAKNSIVSLLKMDTNRLLLLVHIYIDSCISISFGKFLHFSRFGLMVTLRAIKTQTTYHKIQVIPQGRVE